MRICSALFALICAVSIMGWVTAQAQPKLQPRGGEQNQGNNQPSGQVIDHISPENTLNLLKAASYTDLQIYSDNQGTKHVAGKINGQNIAVIHYCDKGVCQYISFVAPLGKQGNVDLAWMNSWNYDKLFAKLMKDKEGNTFFQMDCSLFGGVSPNHITQAGELFGNLIKMLYQYKPNSQ